MPYDCSSSCSLLFYCFYFLAKYFTFFSDILELAFKEIENRTDILPEYSLKLIPKESLFFHTLNLAQVQLHSVCVKVKDKQ